MTSAAYRTIEKPLRVGFICPTWRASLTAGYTEAALQTFFETTPEGVAIVVDDGSPDWVESKMQERLQKIAPTEQSIHFYHFSNEYGLTRSWNKGLDIADSLGLEYVIAGNNDVLFPPNWHFGLTHALANGFTMVGPLSNAPGITAKGKQEVGRYVQDYKVTDDPAYLEEVAFNLMTFNMGKVIESPVNGFFQMCRLEGWRSNMIDLGETKTYYNPLNTHTSKGHKNLTPTMTLNEDEWQGRARGAGLRSGIVLSSFIFHYRAVSRGDKYKRGQWYRKK
jgi:glycosyltransferase involved in cell wall biosynthesis